MSIYKPKRQGLTYPRPTSGQWIRILRRVKRVNTGHDSPCWIWNGRIDVDGYGEAKYNGAKRFVHRIAYAARHGETPGRRDVDHLCHQRACCNPCHLKAEQPKINAAGWMDEMPAQVNKHNLLDYVETDATVPF